MCIHHAQRHLLLSTQGLVQICKISSDAGAGALCCAGDLKHTRERYKCQNRSMIICILLRSPLSYMFSVCHAYSILNYLLATFYLLHDAHQLPRVLGHLLCEGSDTVGHVENGCTNLIGFSLKNGMLLGKIGQYITISFSVTISNMATSFSATLWPWCLPYSLHTQHMRGPD